MREKAIHVTLRFPTLMEMDAYIKAIDIACYEVLKSQVILYCKLLSDEKKLAISKYNALELSSIMPS